MQPMMVWKGERRVVRSLSGVVERSVSRRERGVVGLRVVSLVLLEGEGRRRMVIGVVFEAGWVRRW